MAEESADRHGHEYLDLRQRSDRGRVVRARLSLQPRNPPGSLGDSDLWDQTGAMEEPASMRDDVGGMPAAGERHDDPGAYPGDGGGLRAGDDGSSGDGERRGTCRLPPIGKLDSAQLPHVAHGYRQALGTPASEDSAAWLRDRDALHDGDLNADFRRLTHASIRELQKIMDMETDGQDSNFSVILRAKTAGATAQISSQTKVDENQLRAATIDRLPELLELLKKEQLKLAELRAAAK